MGKPWALGRERERERGKGSLAWPSVKGTPKELKEKKRTRLGYLGTVRAREGIIRKCRKESARI